jgi:hypothetical protein
MSFEYHEPLTFAFDLNVIPRSIIFTESRKSKPEGLFYIANTITLLNDLKKLKKKYSNPHSDCYEHRRTYYTFRAISGYVRMKTMQASRPLQHITLAYHQAKGL